MANISIHVTDEVEISPMSPLSVEADLPLSIDITTYLSGPDRTVYQKDQIYLHGNVEDFRRFAEKILAALPVPVAPEPECECKTAGDQADASDCPLHQEVTF